MFEWVDELLARTRCGHLLDLEYARRLLREHREGTDRARKVWAVMVFCLWYARLDSGA